ncbi:MULTISPECIES: SDR family NAD(P)-dependent oxidoreductase [unclassified Bradyrhizobium]|uniref:SDR family NAD(P)-dependent oxidoreductase n=1 Tax=unclassified Bradyrhizobium TaxID=2631580 RepID=UPI001CD7C006|nr:MULTISPECIES: SDR family NAD(P)-dependent oxidoreductase [unclassified Bradyrhizobium]MCA1375515.1 SDR family oxidoreductase [Bradyrhizobium sp. IC4060]MCA1485206.1 SDR family oxidoreductase [Bradyrhizobium sp. IC4061]
MMIERFSVKGYGAIVTGGASGTGLAFVEALADSGARVAILDVDSISLGKQVDRLSARGLDVRGHKLDVTDRKAVDQVFAEVAAEYGRLDVVFANAGIDPGIGFSNPDGSPSEAGAIENYEDERWNRTIEIHLNGIFATIRAAARHMKRGGGGGSIVVTTSIAAYLNEGMIGAAYMAAKAGAAHLARNAALELAPHKIRVNAVAPGFIVTNIGGGWLKQPEVQNSIGATVPIGRLGDADDLKGLALFLASPASSYITGAQIPIDGGVSLGKRSA